MAGEVEIGARSGTGSQPHALAGDLAERQHGVTSRAQLLSAGVSAKTIKTLQRVGALRRIHLGVYAVGHRRLSREGEWMAAVLAGGPGAVLSHEAAAINWQLLSPFPSLPSITAPIKGRRRPGIVHHAGRLPADEITIHDQIPTTTVARTLLDLANALNLHRLERTIAEAEFRGYADSPSLCELTERYRGSRGVGRIRAVLAGGRTSLGVTRSALEDRFLLFLDDRGLERPELNPALELGDGQVIYADCLWRQIGLVVELDGRAAHQRRTDFERDRLRDRRLSARGWRPVRLTSEQLEAADELEADLLALGVSRRMRRDPNDKTSAEQARGIGPTATNASQGGGAIGSRS